MKKTYTGYFWLALLFLVPLIASAQQRVAVMSKCGGVDTVIIPYTITDRDSDGMDDHLEQLLLDKFMPVVIQFSNENCPGPALNGTGDSNLIACHIYPIPQQYTRSSSYDSILTHPVPVVGPRQLRAGLIWYDAMVKINTAVLYGQDCGLSGHNADVEGFNFSIKYTGPDSAAGWMYDTLMNRWVGATIQTVSHAATLCQQVETYPYRSYLAPAGKDSVFASPNKHGNYLTISGCGQSIICNPGCGSTQITKICRNINLGEPNATLVTDLGTYYAAYAGSDPWTTANFLAAQGGNAGAIRDKMILPLTSDFITGHTLTAAEICPLYSHCYGPERYAYSDVSCANVPYTFHGRTLTQSGSYTDTLADRTGCDSVVALSLTIYQPAQTAQSAYVCSGHTYAFGGALLSVPGTYQDTLTDVHGCDSTLILSLSLHTPTAYTFSQHLCEGNAYTLNGQVLTASGVYVDTVTNIAGCDSVITLTLAIDTPVNVVWSGNTDTVPAHGNAVLMTATPAGGSYTGNGVSGNIFFPANAAAGPNIITYTYTDVYGCISTATRTYYVQYPAGINEPSPASSISLYPNPVNDLLIAQSDLFQSTDRRPQVSDITGQEIAVALEEHENQITFHTSSLSPGVYLVRFNVQGMQVVKKFVKE